MKRMIWRALFLSCAGALVFAGCGSRSSGSSAQSAGAKLPLRYYMPGAPSTEWEAGTAAINEALARDGLNIDFQPNYIPWDQWVDKINLMLSTGDEFELLHIMEDYIPTSTYASRNHLTPLSALIQKEAPGLMGRFEQVLWDCATVNGEIYSIPANWRDNSGDYEGDIIIRKDMFDKYNIPYPQDASEIISALTTLQERWSAEDGVKRYVYEHALNRTPTALHRTYDTWPYYVSQDGIFQVRQNGEANLYWETGEFRKDAEFMNTLYTRGMIHPDVLNLPADTRRSTIYDSGDFLLCLMTGPFTTFEIASKGIVPYAEILKYKMAFDKPMLMNLPLLNANGIPVTAKHPETALQFLDWMYSSQANQDVVLHGVEGRHWTPVGTGQRSHVRGPDGNNLYALDFWMIEYVKYHRFDVEDHSPQEEKDNWLRNIYPDRTAVSPMVGFNFNSQPVRVEFANVMAEYTASILPIKTGVLPYLGNFDAALSKMKAAGSDAVIAEYRGQLAAYLAGRQ
jgi:putative aldouronate transport system substrate-binding protein